MACEAGGETTQALGRHRLGLASSRAGSGELGGEASPAAEEIAGRITQKTRLPPIRNVYFPIARSLAKRAVYWYHVIENEFTN